MPSNPRAQTSRSAARPRFQLAAHTEGANTLAEKAFHGEISQEDYDAQTYSTTIVSTNRATSVPIVLALDDSLATLKAYAHRKFKIPLATAEKTKMCVLWSTKVFYAIGVHPVAETLDLLHQDTLNMILTFMKASPQVEQLLVQFEGDVAEVAAELESIAMELNQAEAEADDDTPAQKEEHLSSPSAKDRGITKGKEHSSSRKGKEQERAGVDRNARDSVENYQKDLSILAKQSKYRVNIAKQQDKPKEVRARSESHISASSSDASGSSRGHSKEEKCGNRRGGH